MSSSADVWADAIAAASVPDHSAGIASAILDLARRLDDTSDVRTVASLHSQLRQWWLLLMSSAGVKAGDDGPTDLSSLVC